MVKQDLLLALGAGDASSSLVRFTNTQDSSLIGKTPLVFQLSVKVKFDLLLACYAGIVAGWPAGLLSRPFANSIFRLF
jgi:hypothetical protein